MNFLKKLFKNKRGSQLVENIMLWGFAVAAGGAVILYTSNVIIEAKNHNIAGLNLSDGGGGGAQSQIGIKKMEMCINDSDGYNPMLNMTPDASNGNAYAWSYTFSSGYHVHGSGEESYFTFTEEIYCGFRATFQNDSTKSNLEEWGDRYGCSNHPMSFSWEWECSEVHKIMISEDASTAYTYTGDWELVQGVINIEGHNYLLGFIGNGLCDEW